MVKLISTYFSCLCWKKVAKSFLNVAAFCLILSVGFYTCQTIYAWERFWCQYLIHQNKACRVTELVDMVHLRRRLLPCFSSVFHGPYATEAGYVRLCVHSRDRFAYAPKSRCPEALGCHKGCLSFEAFLLCFVCVWATIKGNYSQLQTCWRLFLILTMICFTYSRIMPCKHKIIACCRSRISYVMQIFPMPVFFFIPTLEN